MPLPPGLPAGFLTATTPGTFSSKGGNVPLVLDGSLVVTEAEWVGKPKRVGAGLDFFLDKGGWLRLKTSPRFRRSVGNGPRSFPPEAHDFRRENALCRRKLKKT